MEEDRQRKVAKRLGEALARLRSERGLNQDEVADALGIGPEAVSRIERGVALPSVVRLLDFADVFDCKASDLLAAGSDRPSDLAATLAKQLATLHPDDRAFVLEMAGALCAKLAPPRKARSSG